MNPTIKHHVTPKSERIPLFRRVAWGAGGIADNYIINAFLVLAMPIYNIGLGIDPMLIGYALFFPRFLDAITDPMMGNISDNTRSRWGRRRPYIVIGVIISALLLPFLWMPPFESDQGKFLYIVSLGSLYLLAYTVYVVPYTALGFEFTNDYDERTRVLSWRMYLGLLASMSVPWFYKLCLMPVWGDEVRGAVFVSIFIGAVILLTGLLPAIYGKEAVEGQHQEKIRILEAVKFTLMNKPFRIMMLAYVIIITSINTCGTLGLYINIYYVCQGDKSFAATLAGYAGSLGAVISYLSLFLITWISVFMSKRHAMMAGLCFAAAGTLSLAVTLTPEMPYLQLVSVVIMMLGLQGCWLMVDSMTADVCDEDELVTGRRREGLYSAVKGFTMKLSMSLAAIFQGTLLEISGFDSKLAEETGHVAPEILTRLLVMFISIQTTVLVTSIVIFYFYPITRERANETRRLLDARHAADNPAGQGA